MAVDFSALKSMTYSGRGITAGWTSDGTPFMGYTLTGRSPPSQARILVHDEETGVVRTEATDPRIVAQDSPALTLYPAMVEANGIIMGSNGAQTSLIYSQAQEIHLPSSGNVIPSDGFEQHHQYDEKKQRWIDITTFEPDSNQTPRIFGAVDRQYLRLGIAFADEGGEHGFRSFGFPAQHGMAALLATYDGGNESPKLLAFQGQPRSMLVQTDDLQEIVDGLSEAVRHGADPTDNYFVSAAVYGLGQTPLINNRFQRVEITED